MFIFVVTNGYQMPDKRKVLPLRNMPDTIRDIILEKQLDEKRKCRCMRSMEWSLYSIVREWKQFHDQTKFISQEGAKT